MSQVNIGIKINYEKALQDYNKLLTKMSGQTINIKINPVSGKVTQKTMDDISKSTKKATDDGKKYDDQNKKTANSQNKLNKEVKNADGFFTKLGKSITHDLGEMMKWSIAATAIYGSLRKIGEAIEYVTSMDTALTNIRMASGLTREQTQGLAQDYLNLGKELGIAVEEIASSATELYRQGLNTAEVNDRLADYIKLSKVLGRDLQSTIEMGTAGTTAFGVSIQKLGDIASAVGDATASSGDEIMIAIQKAGMSAQTAGVSLEELSAMAATVSATTRESGSIVGVSLKSILAKLSQVDDLTGEINDDYGKTLSRLTDMGIEIEDQSGNLLNATGILKNVGNEWDNLSGQEQKYLASGFGVYQLNRFSSLIKGMTESSGEYTDNLKVAYESYGTTAKKYEEYSQSIEASTARMRNEWKELYQNTINSGLIISMVDLIGKFANFIDEAELLNISLIALGVYGVAMLTAKIITLLPILATCISYFVAFGFESLVLLGGINLLIPAIILVSAVTAGLVYAFKQADKKLADSIITIEKLTGAMDEQEQAVDGIMSSIVDLIDVEELSESQKEKLKMSYDSLAKIMPEIIGLVDRETASATDMANAYLMVADAKKQAAIETLRLQKVSLMEKIHTASETKNKVQLQGEDKLFGGGVLGVEMGSLAQSITQVQNKDIEALGKINKDIKELENRKITLPSIENKVPSSSNNKTDYFSSDDDSKSIKHINPLDALQKYRDEIDKVTLSLSALEAEKASATDEEMVGILERENEQYKLRQIALHEYKLSLDIQAKNLKKDSETYVEDLQKIRDEQKKLGLEWWDDEKAIQANIKAVGELGLKIVETNKKLAEVQKKSLDELRELIEDYIKTGIEQQIEGQEKLIDLAKEELDTRLKLIDAEKDLNEFTKNRVELEKSITKDTDKINKLKVAASQGDAKAQAELLILQENRAKSEEQLNELITDRAIDSTKEKLESEFDLYEEFVNKRIDSLKEELNDAGNITRQANEKLRNYLSDSSNTLYTDLINWNSKYGTGMDSDVISKWEEAIELVKQYNSTLSGGFTFGGAMSAIGSITSSGDKNSVIAKMKSNSALWQSSSSEDRQRLHSENKKLAETIGYSYSSDGRYYPTDPSKERVALYDNGGMKPKGEIGILGKNVKEWIFDDSQLKSVQKMAITEYIKNPPSISNISNSSSPSVNVVIEGSVSDGNLTKITSEIKDVVTRVSQGQLDSFRSRGIKLATSTR